MTQRCAIPVLLLTLLGVLHGCVLAREGVSFPEPPPGTYTIYPDADFVRIPFEMFRDDIRMMSRIDGKEARMLIDNGALWDELMFFGSEKVDALALRREGKAQLGGAGSGSVVECDVAEGITISFDALDGRKLTFYGQTGIITPYESGKPNPWRGAEGQVSAQFFKHFIVEMDFDAGIITLTKPDKFRAAGKGQEVPITPMPDSSSWSIPGKITLHDGRTLRMAFTMDLGWGDPLGITTGQEHDIRAPDGLRKVALGVGAQGEIFGYKGTVPVLEIAGFRFRDVPTSFASKEDGGSRGDEVLVGMGIFRRFRIVFDYPGHRLFLQPSGSFEDPFRTPSGGEDS